uniref:Tudor domain-containing protein n=1 Tax=Caenorhabditis tropicalis TaxID=1561998 RepID=A0A1I7UZ94_9PELO
MEFGGGLGRFAIANAQINTCRELLEVPGGPEWKIRKLQEHFDKYCWKYPGSSVIVNYHLRRLQIDLYHPTVSGLNVCQRFFPFPEDAGKTERIARSWDAHCKKVNEDFEEDMDFEEENGDGDYFPTTVTHYSTPIQKTRYVARLPKCQRAPRFEKDLLVVEYIENSQVLYLQYPWQIKKREEINGLLVATWHQLPKVPEGQRIPDQCCAIRNPRLDRVCRGVIVDETTVLLVDYGRFVKVPGKSADLRLLPAEGLYMVEPMINPGAILVP